MSRLGLRSFHKHTSHTQKGFAPSEDRLDFSEQPSLYRNYQGRPVPAADIPETLSDVLQYSLSMNDGRRLRVNPSSGCLHPIECYVVAGSSFLHYLAEEHALEERGTVEEDPLEKDHYIFCLTALVYRQVWKYGPRGVRYALLDAGHAVAALTVALSLHSMRLYQIEDREGLFVPRERVPFCEQEFLVGCFSTKPNAVLPRVKFSGSPSAVCKPQANVQHWPLAEAIVGQLFPVPPIGNLPHAHYSRGVIMQRRSARKFGPDAELLPLAVFRKIAANVFKARPWEHLSVSYAVHCSEAPGVYDMRLKRLKGGSFAGAAHRASCRQRIARDGLFTACIAALDLEGHYAEAHVEAGMFGHLLYLEAEAAGLRANGMGCFFDDERTFTDLEPIYLVAVGPMSK